MSCLAEQAKKEFFSRPIQSLVIKPSELLCAGQALFSLDMRICTVKQLEVSKRHTDLSCFLCLRIQSLPHIIHSPNSCSCLFPFFLPLLSGVFHQYCTSSVLVSLAINVCCVDFVNVATAKWPFFFSVLCMRWACECVLLSSVLVVVAFFPCSQDVHVHSCLISVLIVVSH